jgi:hypothetical protein
VVITVRLILPSSTVTTARVRLFDAAAATYPTVSVMHVAATAPGMNSWLQAEVLEGLPEIRGPLQGPLVPDMPAAPEWPDSPAGTDLVVQILEQQCTVLSVQIVHGWTRKSDGRSRHTDA